MSIPLETRARNLVDLKDRYQKAKLEAEAAERAYREEEREFWMDLAEDPSFGKVKTVTLDLGEDYGTVQFQRRETITATILNKDEAARALAELGHGEEMLGAPEIRKRVLNELVRNILQSGGELPAGVDFHPRRYITVTKKGGGK